MFAGPNGSGKSTILDVVREELGERPIGVYVNADDIQREIAAQGSLNLDPYPVAMTRKDARAFFAASDWLREKGQADAARSVDVAGNRLSFSGHKVNAYLAAVAADLIRRRLLAKGESFTFETVMSSASKVDFLAEAQRAGYRTYLYFIATDDPAINVSRVNNRVKMGGHPVPRDAVVSRYHRSIALLLAAMKNATRAFVFDNSGNEPVLVAEADQAGVLEVKVRDAPRWFARLLDPLDPAAS